MAEIHRIFYEQDDKRQYWECQTCSSSGSVGPWGDVEEAAEKAHVRIGVAGISRVNKRTVE